ncbi:MAG: GtrA family protein [Desulfobulbus sp.]|jgi:putative flippase GtrA
MKSQTAEISRYIINGLVATAVHYGVLNVNINFLEFKSAGLANLIAAIFGVITSFLGSRYFVFKRVEEGILQQALKFSGLYGSIAVLHGLLLWIWTDWMGLDYRLGFLIATGMQVLLSYMGNKFLVFKL